MWKKVKITAPYWWGLLEIPSEKPIELSRVFDALPDLVHLNLACTCCLYGMVRNGFEAGKIHYEGHWKGWALEIETFLLPEMTTSLKTIRYKFHIKKTGSLIILCTWVCLQLCCVLLCVGIVMGRGGGGEADLPTHTHPTEIKQGWKGGPKVT